MPSFLGSSFLSSSIIKICICSLNTVLFGRLTCAFMYQYPISRVFHFHYWKPRVFISLLMPRISGSILHSRSPNPGDYVSISNLTNCTFLYFFDLLTNFTSFSQRFYSVSSGFYYPVSRILYFYEKEIENIVFYNTIPIPSFSGSLFPPISLA